MADYTKQVNTDIKFEDESTNNPTSFYWDFGDNTPIEITTNKIVIHKYTSTGTYDITHKATNISGTGECAIKTIKITTEAPEDKTKNILLILGGIGVGIGVIYYLTKKK